MGSNKNKKAAPTQQRQPDPVTTTQPAGNRSPVPGSSDIFNPSGNDPRGRVQNRILDESSRFRGQMDPYIGQLQGGFGDALDQSQQDYGNIMSRYQDVASSNPITARQMSYTDPFTSYGDYQGFSKTGGYSPTDIADLRSRGAAPVRAAYAQAEQGVNRQRALQGGYSPNATAVLAKMAREQSQAGADAMQNVNAGIVNSRNQNQLAGLAGMRGIEDSRLNAQLDTSKFNANAQMQADQYNNQNRIDALRGMTSLYGTTPARANMFGQQLGNAIQNSGQQGSSYFTGENAAQNQPGAYDQTKSRIGDVVNAGTQWIPKLEQAMKGQQPNINNTSFPQDPNANNTWFPQDPGNQASNWDPTQWGNQQQDDNWDPTKWYAGN